MKNHLAATLLAVAVMCPTLAAGQQAFTHRALMNSLASKGAWKADLESNKAA